VSEIELRAETLPATIESRGAMRLVEWAQEATAANHLAKALVRTPFAGSWRNDEDGATAAILKGAEIGLTPVTALSAFDNIQGTPAPKALTLRALVQSHGHELEIIEETAERAVARYRRNGAGDWLTTEFTIEDADGLKLLGKDNWQKQPKAMLVARVTSKAARLVASDVILGIGYSSEELRDHMPPTRRAERLPAAPQDDPWYHEAPTQPQTDSEAAGSVPSPDAAPVEVPASPTSASESPYLNTSSKLAKHMFALMNELGITERADRLLYASDVVGRQIASSAEMTDADAERVVEAAVAELDKQAAQTGEQP